MQYTVSIIEREFTPRETEVVTDVSVTTQRDWRRRELLPQKTTGGWTVFRLGDVVGMMVMKLLSESGIPLKVAADIAQLSKLPVLTEFTFHPEIYSFEGIELSQDLRDRIINSSVVESRGRYLLVPLGVKNELLYHVSRGDDVQSMLDAKAGSEVSHHLIVDHVEIASRLMKAVSGPLFRVMAEEIG